MRFSSLHLKKSANVFIPTLVPQGAPKYLNDVTFCTYPPLDRLRKTLNIDLGEWNAHPFIAPDESYIIWDAQRESGYGKADLYISFKKKNGTWGAAINLGDKINTEFGEAYGSVSPDGKYFFFHRSYGGDTGDIFWMDAKFIEDLRLQ